MLVVITMAVCVLYTAALLIGWYLAKRGRLDFAKVIQNRRTFADPLTRRFQQWCQGQKMEVLRQRQWGRLRLLVFANNLGSVALVGRTVYGIALAPAVYFTYRQGLTQGTFAAQPLTRPRGTLLKIAVLEFGAYLLATALGDQSPPTFAPVVAKLAKALPRVDVLTFPGAGHIPHATHPDAYFEATVAFTYKYSG